MNTITVEPNRLTKEEINSLRRLQIEVIVKPLPKKKCSKRKKLKPYTLELFYSCKTCKNTFSIFYKMEAAEKRGLRSKKLSSSLAIPDKREERMIITCNKCKEILKGLPKEEIINKYLKEKGGKLNK